MKKALYFTNADYLILPKRLGKLVEIYGKPVKTMLEYDPSKVDDKWGNVDHLFYVSGRVSEKNFSGTIYGDYDTADKIRAENTKTAIGRVMQEKGFKIMDFEKKDARIKELEQENEELKSLPPVNIETINCDDLDIYPADDPRSKFYKEKFDEKLDENLTGNKKRGRSTRENKK